jgi:hypothetical protein
MNKQISELENELREIAQDNSSGINMKSPIPDFEIYKAAQRFIDSSRVREIYETLIPLYRADQNIRKADELRATLDRYYKREAERDDMLDMIH